MGTARTVKIGIALGAVILLGACGGTLFGKTKEERIADQRVNTPLAQNEDRETIWDLFGNQDDPNVTVEVNRYLWNAALDVLNFMPVQAADPFSGIIQFGYGTPPGGRRAYQATVLVNDPALDARSLTVSLRSRGGAVGIETQRQIEDAILTRARQLRIADSKL